ncbi:hypothetical protein FSST1_003760 [Fusarium sambucinum]
MQTVHSLPCTLSYTQAQENRFKFYFNESHDAKKPASKHRAIFHLHYTHILMLTGTPIHNTFADLAGQTMLLPGGGFFTSIDHFSHMFCKEPVLELEATTWKVRLFRRLFQGLIVARPKRVVTLPPKQELNHLYRHLRGASMIWAAKSLLRLKGQIEDLARTKELYSKAMGQLTKAERLASCPLLVKATLKDGVEESVQRIEAYWCAIETRCIEALGQPERDIQTIIEFLRQPNTQPLENTDTYNEDDELGVNEDTQEDPADGDYDDGRELPEENEEVVGNDDDDAYDMLSCASHGGRQDRKRVIGLAKGYLGSCVAKQVLRWCSKKAGVRYVEKRKEHLVF